MFNHPSNVSFNLPSPSTNTYISFFINQTPFTARQQFLYNILFNKHVVRYIKLCYKIHTAQKMKFPVDLLTVTKKRFMKNFIFVWWVFLDKWPLTLHI